MSCKVCGCDEDLNECANCGDDICDICCGHVGLDEVCSRDCARELMDEL